MRPTNQVRHAALVVATLIAAYFCFPAAAQAIRIVDTGISSTNGSAGGYVLSSSERRTSFSGKSASLWLSTEFILDKEDAITDVEGWISLRRPAYPATGDAWGNTFRIAIYGDGGETPDVSNVKLYQEFSINKSTLNIADWRGLQGLNLVLPAGEYWVAFEVPAFVGAVANNTWGVMPFSPAVPNPLEDVAYLSSSQGNIWIASDTSKFGVRIAGNAITQAQVPEPTTMLLLGLGLIGVVGVRRKIQ